ncbi:MAG: DUF4367 domain-containing protein [Firmicutes bacterium]|nr:DUF4367 domain-containing protein [Bacillota bacterium]
MKLEEWLRAAMAREAEQIEAGPDLVRKIKTRLLMQQGKGRAILITWRKAAAATLCGALLVGGLVFGLSPQARAWANKAVISPVLSVVYKVIRTGDGYTVTKLQEGKDHPGDGGARFGGLEKMEVKEAKRCPEFSTAAAAQAHVGFSVHLPTYLPEGYRLISMTGDRQEKSDRGFVSVVYGVPKEAGKRLLLTITNERNFLQGGDAVQEVKVRGKTAYWAEFPIMEINDAGKEPAVKVGHTLKWEDKGLVYMLEDGSGTLSLEEMLKIAASVD